MSIPVATTTITVKHPAGTAFERQPATVGDRAVRAHIGQPSGSEQRQGGSRGQVDKVLVADPCTISNLDLVVDDADGTTWQVVWVNRARGLGLDHVKAGLVRVVG